MTLAFSSLVILQFTFALVKTILMDTGSDAILLGAETLRGIYPVETISTVGRICAEVNTFCASMCIYGCM